MLGKRGVFAFQHDDACFVVRALGMKQVGSAKNEALHALAELLADARCSLARASCSSVTGCNTHKKELIEKKPKKDDSLRRGVADLPLEE